jgi:hypothetical protein
VAVPDASQPTAAAVAPTPELQAESCHIVGAVGIEDWGGVKLGLLMLLTDVWVLVLDVLN